MLNTFFKIFQYEVILLLRYSREWLYPLIFFVTIITFFPIAFSPEKEFMQMYFAGCVWIAATLASLLSVQTIFAADFEDGHFEQLFLCELPLAFLLLPKLIAQWVITQLPLILLTPLFGILFHLPVEILFFTALSLLVGTPILLLIGCTGVALTIGLRQQGVLLALLVMPLSIPVLIFGVMIIQQAQAGFSPYAPLLFFSGLSLLSITVIPLVIAAALQINIDD